MLAYRVRPRKSVGLDGLRSNLLREGAPHVVAADDAPAALTGFCHSARRRRVRADGIHEGMTLTARKPLADLQQTEAGEPTLRRALGPLHLTALGIGSIIGTGIFVLTGTAARRTPGPALVLSMIIAAVGCALPASATPSSRR